MHSASAQRRRSLRAIVSRCWWTVANAEGDSPRDGECAASRASGTYIFSDDEIGRALRELLIGRRQQGIEVRVLYDAIGSVTTPAEFFEPMRQAGVEVLPFRPLNPTRTLPWKINNRDHRKIVVVDGRVAFTGGINISSTYASASSSRPGPDTGREEAWRDTHVLKLQSWRERPMLDRFKEFASGLFSYWL